MVDFSPAVGLASLGNSINSFVNNWNQNQNQNLALQQQNWKLANLQDLGTRLSQGDYTGAINDMARTGDVSMLPSLLALKQQSDQMNAWNGGTPSGGSLSGLGPNAGAGASPTPSGQSGGSGLLPQLKPVADQATQKFGLDPSYIPTTLAIESAGGRNLGSRGNPGQFDAPTAASIGMPGAVSDPAQSVIATGALAAQRSQELATMIGRQPTPAEVYLAHQQGTGGAAALINHPNEPAGKYVSAQNIAANGGDPNAPASQFVNMWGVKWNAAAKSLGYTPGNSVFAQAQQAKPQQVASGPVAPLQGNGGMQSPTQPMRVASANPTVPTPDTLPPPSAQQGGAAQAPKPSTSGPLAIAVPGYKGTFTRAQAEAASDNDDSTPGTDEWDAAAKAATLGQPAAPGAPAGAPQPAAPASPAGADRALEIAKAAGLPQTQINAIANTQPGTPARQGVLSRIAGMAATLPMAASLKPVMDQLTATEALPKDIAEFNYSQQNPAYGEWEMKEKTPPGQLNLADALANWKKYNLPDPNDPANAQFWRDASAKGLGLSPTPLVTVDQRGQTDMQKHAIDALATGYQGITGGTGGVQRLNALNRMQSNLNNGIIEGYGPAQPAAQATANLLAKLGIGDPTKLANTQEFVSDGLQEVMAAAKGTFPQRITNADLKILTQSNAADPAQLQPALQHIIDSLRETTVQGIEQHNANVERYAKAFPNEADQARGLFGVDMSKLPAPVGPSIKAPNGQDVPLVRSKDEFSRVPPGGLYTEDGVHIFQNGGGGQQ